MSILSHVNSIIFLSLALLHFYWGFGGTFGMGYVFPNEFNKKPAKPPGSIACFVVGTLLFIPLVISLNYQFEFIESDLILFLSYGISLLFFLRGIGEFKYVGLFKKIKHTPFAKWDTKLYTPLCFCIALINLLLI